MLDSLGPKHFTVFVCAMHVCVHMWCTSVKVMCVHRHTEV